LDGRSVSSLGVVLYEYSPPKAFSGETLATISLQDRSAEFPPLADISKNVPAEFDSILGRRSEGSVECYLQEDFALALPGEKARFEQAIFQDRRDDGVVCRNLRQR
jgi:hypothetical protein